MNYLVLSVFTLTLLYGVYRLVLSRTTLHRFNRILLLSILALSVFLPAVRIGSWGLMLQDRLTFRNHDVTEAYSQEVLYARKRPLFSDGEYYSAVGSGTMGHSVNEGADVSGSAPVTAVPASSAGNHGLWRFAWMTAILETVMQMDMITAVTLLYIGGVAFFFLRLLIGIIRVSTLCRLGGRKLSDGSRLVVCDGDFQPTSWMGTVILSRRDHESDNADMIVRHEQAHIRMRHSIDVLIAQTACALQWFNPAAWALKRSLQEIHEYEADAAVLAGGENGRQYQICLVQAALGGRIGYVTSNFADCSTKKRIKMMNSNHSSPFVCLRALLMLPVVAVIILAASACKSDASRDSGTKGSITVIEEPIVQLEPLDTAFMKKFGLGANQDLKIKQLNNFVEIEWDGGIWITVDGEQTFHPATLDNFAAEFERLKKESTVEVARPDLVFVANANDEHLDIAQNIIKQLQKSYSDDKILLITLPGKKTVPPPPVGYAIDYNSDKCVEVEVSRRNGIHVTAYNVTRVLTSAQELRPTIESFATSAGTDSVAVEVRADGTILVKVPKLTYDVDSPEKLKGLLLRLYPGADEKVFYKVEYRFATSSRLVNEVEHIFSDNPDKYEHYRAKEVTKVFLPMATRQDSIKQILLGEYKSRSRHVKDMKWYNENRDKEEFFRMGFRNGQICVGKGNDPSNMMPIEFDQLVSYFRENCPGGDERKAIVLFEINQDGTVPVAYMDKVLEKMENWITTQTRRIWVSDRPIRDVNVVEIISY